MTSLKVKFDESNVINALHKNDAKKFTTGIFADDIITLKEAVENCAERKFGDLSFSEDAKGPFRSSKGHNTYLFYPITYKELFGNHYTDYLKNYELGDYKKVISHKELLDIVNTKNKNCKKYIFSGNCYRKDFMDGEIYNADVEYENTYLEHHGEKGKTVLIVTAPNELLAKMSADIWFTRIGGWHRSGCNVYGHGWVDSNRYSNLRYFGSVSKKSTDEEAINSIKLFASKEEYNLTGKIVNISFAKDILPSTYFSRYFILDKNSYDFEFGLITTGKYTNEKPLKERVIEAFNKEGISTTNKIYESEINYLVEDFDNTIAEIIHSIKTFDSLDSKLKKDLLKNIPDSTSYSLLRSTVVFKNKKNVHKDVILAEAFFTYSRVDPYVYNICSYKFWSCVKNGINISTLKHTNIYSTLAEESDTLYSDNYFIKVLCINDYIFIPSESSHSTYDDSKLSNKFDYAKNHIIWPNITKDFSAADIIELKQEAFTNIKGVSDSSILSNSTNDFIFADASIDGHKCLKVFVDIQNFNRHWDYHDTYSKKNCLKYEYYKKFVDLMNNKNYHIVKALNYKEDSKYGYEQVNLIFAKNLKKDYSSHFTKEYWDDYVRSPLLEKNIWD